MFATFKKDVAGHTLFVANDTGVHRTLVFQRPGSNIDAFTLVTWPDHLAISGDRGCYVFSRTHDMFTFFRDNKNQNRINPDYWMEKMVADDARCKAEIFCYTSFMDTVRAELNDIFHDEPGAVAQALEDHEFALQDINSAESAHLWAHEADLPNEQSFSSDFIRDMSCTTHNTHFLWALHAIVWGIKQYDLQKNNRTQRDHDAAVLFPNKKR